MKEIFDDKDIEFKIESFALVPSDGGRFEFSVNGNLLYSKKQLGRHAEEGEIIGILRDHIRKNNGG